MIGRWWAAVWAIWSLLVLGGCVPDRGVPTSRVSELPEIVLEWEELELTPSLIPSSLKVGERPGANHKVVAFESIDVLILDSQTRALNVVDWDYKGGQETSIENVSVGIAIDPVVATDPSTRFEFHSPHLGVGKHRWAIGSTDHKGDHSIYLWYQSSENSSWKGFNKLDHKLIDVCYIGSTTGLAMIVENSSKAKHLVQLSEDGSVRIADLAENVLFIHDGSVFTKHTSLVVDFNGQLVGGTQSDLQPGWVSQQMVPESRVPPFIESESDYWISGWDNGWVVVRGYSDGVHIARAESPSGVSAISTGHWSRNDYSDADGFYVFRNWAFVKSMQDITTWTHLYYRTSVETETWSAVTIKDDLSGWSQPPVEHNGHIYLLAGQIGYTDPDKQDIHPSDDLYRLSPDGTVERLTLFNEDIVAFEITERGIELQERRKTATIKGEDP